MAGLQRGFGTTRVKKKLLSEPQIAVSAPSAHTLVVHMVARAAVVVVQKSESESEEEVEDFRSLTIYSTS